MSVWTEAPTLAGRHVTLRPLARGDMPALVTAASADDLWDIFYASVAQMKDPGGFLARVLEEQRQQRSLVFTVLDAAGEIVGTTKFMRMSPSHHRVEIGGTFYTTRVQRTGVNTEAKLMLLTHAFEVLGCQCVQFRTDSLNRRSQAAIERLGATKDGVLRGHQIVAGRLRDSVVYSILDREWAAVRENLRFLLARHV